MRFDEKGMRYAEIAGSDQRAEKTQMRKLMDSVRAVYAERIWPEIDSATADQQDTMRHVVDCHGLTVHDLHQQFAQEFQGRRLWCRKNCHSGFTVAPIWDAALGRDTGRRFAFADQAEAAMFRRTWGARS
ncbi:hypothetical protein ACLF3G_28290 [Falsiroseomonas sp. HC035]|uniref:hypothetical protein n=1 Tax=Falsiroseomonas sp. HC035 TaxID=3390999 RepID=UPI003D31BA54